MIRTQVYLTEEQAQDIKLRAKREKKREAEVIRDLLDRGREAAVQEQGESAGTALLRLAKIGGRAPADLSARVDDYLYDNNE